MFKPRSVSTNAAKRTLGKQKGSSSTEPKDLQNTAASETSEPVAKKARSRWGPLIAQVEVRNGLDGHPAGPSELSAASAAGPLRHARIVDSFPQFSDSKSVSHQNMFPCEHVRDPIVQGVRTVPTGLAAQVDDPELQSDYKGYFNGGISHVLSGRYRLMAHLGKGAFASVHRCVDLVTGMDVALKILRKGKTAGRSGLLELNTLRQLHTDRGRSHSGEGSQFIISLLDNFEERGHVVMVLERMHTSLRELLKVSKKPDQHNMIFVPGGGIRPAVVLTFARQMLEALSHIHGLAFAHLDIKPDNILVSQDFSHCKICDFGVSESTSEIKNLSALNMGVYFAARYYRSPELALAYGVLSSSADIWALGITIAEMCGGRAVFRGRNNCELVWSIMSTLGPVPKEMSQNCKKAAFFGSKDAEYYNLYEFIPPGSDDAVTLNVRKLPKPEKRGAADRLLAIMQPVSSKSADIRSTRNSGKDRKMILDIRDLLLEKLLVLDPSKRMTAKCLLREEVVLSSVMDRDSHSQF